MSSIFTNIVNYGHQDNLLLPTNVLANLLNNLGNSGNLNNLSNLSNSNKLNYLKIDKQILKSKKK